MDRRRDLSWLTFAVVTLALSACGMQTSEVGTTSPTEVTTSEPPARVTASEAQRFEEIEPHSLLWALDRTNYVVESSGVVSHEVRTRSRDEMTIRDYPSTVRVDRVVWASTHFPGRTEPTAGADTRSIDLRDAALGGQSIVGERLLVGLQSLSEVRTDVIEERFAVTFVAVVDDSGRLEFVGPWADRLQAEADAAMAVVGSDDLVDLVEVLHRETLKKNTTDQTSPILSELYEAFYSTNDSPTWSDAPMGQRDLSPRAIPAEFRDEFEVIGLEVRLAPLAESVDQAVVIGGEWGVAHSFDVKVGDHLVPAVRGRGEALLVLLEVPDGEDRILGSIEGVSAGDVAIVEFETDVSGVVGFSVVGTRPATDGERQTAAGFGIGPNGELVDVDDQ